MKLYKTINVLDTSDVTLYDLYYIHINKGITKNVDVVDDGIYFAICTYVGKDFIIFIPIAKNEGLLPSTKSKPIKITSDNVQCVINISHVVISSGYDDYGRWIVQLKESAEMYNT